MKKLLVLLVAVLMVVSSAFALELSEPGVLPLTTEDITLTIGIPQAALTTDYEENYVTQLIEETTGVKLDFMLFPTDSSEARQKISLMIASEEKLPDILINMGFSDMEKATYGASGYLIDLTDYLENEAYYWNLAMDTWCTEEEKEMVLKYAKSPDGCIYGYPGYYIDPGDATALGMWINKSWCENLGIDIPTTTDEFYAMLKAFKEQDANGNGDPDDEIPLIGHNGWMGNVCNYIINSFVYDAFTSDCGYQLTPVDGQLTAPFITEAYHEALRYLCKLSEEGLLSPLSFSQGQNELRAILSAPNDQDSIIGAFTGHPSPLFGADGSVDRVWEYVGVPAMIGPEGVQYTPFSGQLGTYVTNITCDCEYPELAFRVLDAIAEQDLSISVRYGQKDVDWAYQSEGEIRHKYLDGFYAIYEQLDAVSPWTGENNIIWHTNFANMLPPKLFAGLVAAPYPNANRDQQMNGLWYSTVPLRYYNHPSEVALKLIFTEEELDEVSEIEATIRSYVNESLSRFVLGDMNIESDWDNYLAELEGMGLSYYMEVAQTAYDRMK